MLYRLVRPMRRSGSRIPYFVQRIPADVKSLAVGSKLDIPIGNATISVIISPKTFMVKVSLRTAEPTEAKIRQATAAAYLETVWSALREDAPIPLTHRQATALAGRLYRAWEGGEGRERTTAIILTADGKWVPDDSDSDDVPDFWESASRHLDYLAAGDEAFTASTAPRNREAESGGGRQQPLERAFGPIIDRLLLREGIRRVDRASREMLLNAFRLALKDAFESRMRNATGDYRPDLKA